jgi:hypothetical protein
MMQKALTELRFNDNSVVKNNFDPLGDRWGIKRRSLVQENNENDFTNIINEC